ncbi:MAG TPA: 30S ribosomal protein S9 [Candidatus Babeliaceae bacterium]|nr:30S ribosomal protein S9 [Candidatus Babeliaceae bacterium]
MEKTTKTQAKAPLAHAVGRRKSSVARVWLRRGNGTVTINGKAYNNYFDTEINKLSAIAPFRVLPGAAQRYAVEVNVCGGGVCSQAGAVKLGISRALIKADADLRAALKQEGLLTVDPRVKERKKYGQKGARRKFQFVKR